MAKILNGQFIKKRWIEVKRDAQQEKKKLYIRVI